MVEILRQLITIECLVSLVAGTVGGLVIGALPGLSATMGMALLIPITYGMDTVPAMIMIGAIYVSAVYGGSFSAILIRTPGTPASAATAIDGYELTVQGRGLEAIGVSTIASISGGVISAVALLCIAPQLVKVALMFSAPEYFLITLFGLTIVGSLSGDNMLKGLVSATIGLLAGMIGMNFSPYARYSFGNFNLAGGIQLVPAMIGLFSIPQILILAEKRLNQSSEEANDGNSIKQQIANARKLKGRFFPDRKGMKELIPVIARSSILGIFVGILPGAGGDIGSWVGYNDAKTRSKNKQLFGKGSLEGIAGSEAGNNAVCGGALIPALTLGIPGSGAAAVFLGALTLQGFTPGYNLFTENASMTYAILLGFLAANILMGFLGFLLSKHAVRLASLPSGILLPCIVILSVVGSFAMNNSMFDVYVMLVFGIIGYFMRKFSFPAAPAVLALILGPMAERNLINSLQMSKVPILQYYLTRPLCWVFIVLIILSLVAPAISAKKKAKERILPQEYKVDAGEN
jgi:putative tricarboxylic transport membrane protein